jgi:hypothetical protein
MMEALGRTVLVLKRIRVGPQHIGNLGSGAFRELSEEEVEALYGAGKRAEAQSSPPAAQAGGRLTIGALGPPPPRGKRQR